MQIAGQDFIALVYNPKYGPCYWVAEDGRCVLECNIESKKILDSNELKEEFDKDNLNFLILWKMFVVTILWLTFL